nr:MULTISPECIES: ABC transporter permease subunit [unclassified Streptomyces]
MRRGQAQVAAQGGAVVLGAEDAAFLEQRDDPVDEVVQAAGKDRQAAGKDRQAAGERGRLRDEWDVVGRYFTTPTVLDGLPLTLWLTGAVMVLGFLLGTALAVIRLSANPVLRTLSRGYVWVFRSTPLLVQLLFWFNIGALYPTLGLGIPFGPQFATVKTVHLLGPTLTAVIGLTLHESAYAAEVVRGGMLSVDSGQTGGPRGAAGPEPRDARHDTNGGAAGPRGIMPSCGSRPRRTMRCAPHFSLRGPRQAHR